MPQMGLPLASDVCGPTYPSLSAGSTRPVLHLPGSRPRNVTATVTALPSAGAEDLVPQSFLSAEGVVQDLDVSRFSLGDTFSKDVAGQFALSSVSQDCHADLQSCEYILQLILDDLGKSDLVRDTPNPLPFGRFKQRLLLSQWWALALHKEMQDELTAAFLEPSS